jgi:PAS domain S-box-containing protein
LNKQNSPLLFLVILTVLAVVFISDVIFSLGMAVGFAYIIILFLSSKYLDTLKTLIITALSSLSIFLVVIIPEGELSRFTLYNRILAVILLWMITYLLFRYRKIENSLTYSELQYRTVVEATYEGIIIPDRTGRITFVNKRIADLLGYPEGELKEKKFDDIVVNHGNSYNIIKEEGGENEMSLLKKNGTSILTSVSFIPVKQGWDDVENIIVIKDITARKRTEEALRESQARLSGIVSSAMDAIITINSDQNVILFNKSAEKMFGYSQEEVIGKQIGLLIPRDVRDVHKQYVRNFGATGTTNRHMGALGAVRGLKKNGQEFPIEASISQIKTSGEKLYSVILRDITEREIARQQLLESENRFRNMADNAPVLIWLSDEKDVFTYFNKSWLTFTGRNLEEEKGWGWTERIHSDEKENIINAYKAAFSKKEAFVSEFRLLRTDGTNRWILNHAIPRFTSDKRYNGFIGSCVDITERKVFEEQLNASLKEKEVLLKEVHHRVKNNLQIISSLLSLQAATLKDEKMLELMIESQNRIKSMALIHEKLYQTRALSKIDVRSYITELVDNLVTSYLTDRSSVKMELDIEDIEFDIDTGIDVGLIINELISNSFKYAFPKDFTGEKKISVAIKKNEKTGKVLMLIQDTGIGIRSDFDLAASESLGLQLVDTLVQQFEGTIRFINDSGTTIEIIF